ncbi:MAG: DUF2225 domain-containing protein [Lachnospiraceae bacterium]|nr:DUF2225 domain-containing protein [Lachnospiraceae bacterium]
MNLLAGLEKFGLKTDTALDITKEETKKKKVADNDTQEKQVMTEEDYLLSKEMECPVCDAKFPVLLVKTGKAKMIGQEFDLRPRHEGIDTIKYDVVSCPECGYSAMTKAFGPLSTTQRKWVREAVCDNYMGDDRSPKRTTYSYEEAIDRYKLALVCAMARRAKLSEKSYICLKISWLRRTEYKLLPEGTEEEKAYKNEVKEEIQGFYQQAYDGFKACMSKESPPYYGMDSNTLEFMLANMAMYFKDYDFASQTVSRLLTSPNTNSRVKDKCLNLKEQIAKAKKTAAAPAQPAQ